MKHILVPTDFSPTADKAIEFAVRSAKYLPGKISLLHSYEMGDSLMTDYVGMDREFNTALLAEANGKLEAIQKEIQENHDVHVDVKVSGLPLIHAVQEGIDEEGVDLIIMGTLGASGLGNKIWGSRTSELIGKSKVPVLAVPADYEWEKPARILFATNKFEKEEKILDYIFEMADLYMAGIRAAVFTDADDDRAMKFYENEGKLREYEEYLRFEYKEDTLSSQHLLGEKFEETLQEYIDDKNVDMLIMVTYQDSIWKRFFNPSKTKRMSYHTRIPLLAIPSAFAE